MKKEILIGFLVAVFATICGFYLYVELFSKFRFYETLEIIKEQNLFGKVLGLAAIPNLFVFFVFLKKKQDYRARGVLIATILTAMIMLIMKFL
jgi:Co/Zn/Cd efflux system component